MRKIFQATLTFVRFIVARFAQDRCMETAASLTFTTLLSLVPLFTIALVVFSAFPVFDGFSAQIKSYLLNNLMPETAGVVITKYMQQFTESAARLTTVGIGFLALTAMLMMMTIDSAFNVIWRVTRSRPVLKRLIVYLAVLTLAPLLIGASLTLTSWLVGLSMGYAKNVSVFGFGLLNTLPVIFTTLAFALMYRLVPNRYVPRNHALIGAAVAGVLFETMNQLFGYYVSHFPTYKLVYGAFASIPIFLMWVYMSWLTILLGAEIAASLSYWHTPATKRSSPTTSLLDALRVLQLMLSASQAEKAITFPEISKSLRIGYDELERLLYKLAAAGIVRKAEGRGWVLVRDALNIRASELLRLFVFDNDALQVEIGDDPLQQWFSGSFQQLEKNSDLSLQELLEKSAT